MSQANPVNEGLIHAWLDGQLPAEDVTRIEHLVATDSEWGAAAAEARGLVAASSRVLGALDDVPKVGQEKTRGREDEKTRGREDEKTSERRGKGGVRVWWRAPWMRAAAGIVLVVGVSSVVWMRRGDVVSDAALLKVDDAPAQDAIAEKRVESTAVSSPDSVAPRTLRAQTAAPGAPPAEMRQREADAVGAREIAKSVAEERKSTSDTSARGGAAVVAVAPPPVTTPPVVDQGSAIASTAGRSGAGGGRGGRPGRRVDSVAPGSGAGIGSGVTANALALEAKLLDSTSVDPRLAGCWAPVQTARQEGFARRDRADEQLALPPLMRFIGAVATDVAAAAPASPVPPPRSTAVQGAVQTRQASPAMAEAALMRTVVNATVTRIPVRDSAFVAEWIDANARRVATFTASGDTLRGTLQAVVGDSMQTSALLAARVRCMP
ncbi:MAG TPA: hypothetical protein VJR92_06750 [Gemmatimonadaceae bacterium]|nr:hypothetical protein [Gemmatimonadaceae bacterium]